MKKRKTTKSKPLHKLQQDAVANDREENKPDVVEQVLWVPTIFILRLPPIQPIRIICTFEQ